MSDVEDMVNYAILIAVAVAIILMITGRFLDLSVERQEATQNRATINLLQKIVTEADFLVTDSSGEKLKLMINRQDYGTTGIGECCDSVQYDYRFAVVENSRSVEGAAEPRVSLGFVADAVETNLEDSRPTYDLSDFCYNGFGIGQKRVSSVPVNICEGDDLATCQQGAAFLETTDSPLSQMSYWITQACNSRFDLTKRIPIAVDDYQVGEDVQVKGDRVCFKGTCKRFYCGDIEVQHSDIEDLKEPQQVQSFPPLSCDFVRIVREGSRVAVYDGLPEVGVEVPEGAEDLPRNHDDWTEEFGETVHFSVGDQNNFEVSNDDTIIPEISAAEGDRYILLLSKDRGSNIHDHPLYLDIGNLDDELDDCNGNKCVKMADRGLGKIKFSSIVYPAHNEGTASSLTWKLYDSGGNCIVGKDKVTHEWSEYDISRVGPGSGSYEKCEALGGEFNWEITRVEWNSCETRLEFTGLGCDPTGVIDFVTTMAVDNFYFEVARDE